MTIAALAAWARAGAPGGPGVVRSPRLAVRVAGVEFPNPVGVAADELLATFVQPVLDHLAAAGTPYVGVLYAGLMLTAEGPRLVEYNARFGDPETQVVVPRLTSDLAQLLAEAAAGELGSEPTFDDGAAVAVALAAERTGAVQRS